MAHSGNTNWVKINRSIFDNALWRDSEPFDRRSAWIDLILMANHTDGEFIASGEIIKIPRGSLFTSIEHLGARWNWTNKRVRAYLDVLIRLNMVTRKGTHRGTLISLINYDIYQGQGQTEGIPKGTPEGTPEGTSEGTPEGIRTRIEEIENEEESKEAPTIVYPYRVDRLGREIPEGMYEEDDYDESRSSADTGNDSRQLDVSESTPRSRVQQLRDILRGISTLPGGGSPTGDSQCDS